MTASSVLGLVLVALFFTATRQCSSPFFSSSNGDFCYNIHSRPKLNFADAEEICLGDGGHLISVRNGFDNSLIADFMRNSSSRVESVWLGATRLSDDSSFLWLDGAQFSYEHWDGGEPSSDAGRNCISMNADGTWSASNCSQLQSFVCEISSLIPTIPTTTTKAPTCDEIDCGNGTCYTMVNGGVFCSCHFCYLLDDQSPQRSYDACQQQYDGCDQCKMRTNPNNNCTSIVTEYWCNYTCHCQDGTEGDRCSS